MWQKVAEYCNNDVLAILAEKIGECRRVYNSKYGLYYGQTSELRIQWTAKKKENYEVWGNCTEKYNRMGRKQKEYGIYSVI